MEVVELLTVQKVSEVKADKNGINYKTITLASPASKKVRGADMQMTVIRSRVKKGTVNVFEHNYLDLINAADAKGVKVKDLKKADIKDIEPDFAYDVKEEEKLEGKIVTREVVPYEIPNEATGEVRIVTSYTTPVLGDTSDGFETLVQRAFNTSGHQLLDDKSSQIITVDSQESTEKVFANNN